MHPLLNKQLQEKALSHATMLVGKGESFLALETKELIWEFFGKSPTLKKRIFQENHPDLIITRSDNATITIKDIRQAQQQLSLGPVEQRARFWWIDGAHKLRREGQNALLKTLEEPPSYLYIILTVPWENTLLPTILSRCQIYHYEGEEHMEIPELWTALEKIYAGDDFGIFEAWDTLKDEDIGELFMQLADIFRDQAVYQQTREENLLKYQKKIDMIKKITRQDVDYRKLSLECLRAAEGIRRNVNAQLSFEHLFLMVLEELR